MFNGNPITTTISCSSPNNASGETDLDTFYNELSFLVRSISKHNILIIGRDRNTQIGKNVNNKFNLQTTNFTLEKGLICLNTKFQKRKGKL